CRPALVALCSRAYSTSAAVILIRLLSWPARATTNAVITFVMLAIGRLLYWRRPQSCLPVTALASTASRAAIERGGLCARIAAAPGILAAVAAGRGVLAAVAAAGPGVLAAETAVSAMLAAPMSRPQNRINRINRIDRSDRDIALLGRLGAVVVGGRLGRNPCW